MSTIDRIISILSTRGISQKELTDHLGLDKSTFTQWKNGKSQSYNKYISKIAAFLGVSVDDLFSNDENQEDPDRRELKFALFGDPDVDNDVLDDVLRYAKIARQMREEKNKE